MGKDKKALFPLSFYISFFQWWGLTCWLAYDLALVFCKGLSQQATWLSSLKSTPKRCQGRPDATFVWHILGKSEICAHTYHIRTTYISQPNKPELTQINVQAPSRLQEAAQRYQDTLWPYALLPVHFIAGLIPSFPHNNLNCFAFWHWMNVVVRLDIYQDRGYGYPQVTT